MCFLERAIVTESKTSKKSKLSISNNLSDVLIFISILDHSLKARCASEKIVSILLFNPIFLLNFSL